MKDFIPVLKNVLLYVFCCLKSFIIRFVPCVKHSFKNLFGTIEYIKKVVTPYIKAIKIRWVLVSLGCLVAIALSVFLILGATTDYFILTYKGYSLGFLRNAEMADATLLSIKSEFSGNNKVIEDIDLFSIEKIKVGNIFLKCMDKDEFRDTVVLAAETIDYGYHIFIDDEYIMAVGGNEVFENAMLDFKNNRIASSKDIKSNYDKCDVVISNKVDVKRVCMLTEDIITSGSYSGLYAAFEERFKYRIECLQSVDENIPYMTYYSRNSELAPGAKRIVQEGIHGVKRVQSKVIIENGVLISNKIVNEEITTKSVMRHIEMGSGTSGAVEGGLELLFPIDGYLTSDFGDRPDPFTGEIAFHTGLDIAAEKGAPIQAAASGKVIQASDKKDGYGKCVIIEHASGFSTLYAHCSELNVKEGEYVTAGQVIAKVGSTGRSTGPHLHFSIIINEEFVDPNLYF